MPNQGSSDGERTMKPFLFISFSMPRGLKAGDFYDEYLVFEEGKLNFILKNITREKIEKRMRIPYEEKDLQTLLEIATKSSNKPTQLITDVTLAYAETRNASGETERVFVSDPLFWKIAYRYLSKKKA